MTNEQKLEQIYQIVSDAESRRKSLMWFRIIKWLILIALIALIAMNREYVTTRVIEVVKPFVLSTASGMIANQKEELMKSLQSALPQGVGIQ